MKTLHILKTEPDSNTKALVSTLDASKDEESTVFKLYEEPVDYESLIDLIFEYDKITSWW